MRKTQIFISFVLLIFLVNPTFSQCAMCKAVVENGDTSVAEALNNGITYLMVFPYILIAGLFYMIYRYKKKAKN